MPRSGQSRNALEGVNRKRAAPFKRIQELGVRVLFDDFGTGYASLSYLKKFPRDGLKIDRSFVLDLLADSDDAGIVGSTIGLSEQVGLTIVAEGIENRATADFLVSMGARKGWAISSAAQCPWTRSKRNSWRLSAKLSALPDGPVSMSSAGAQPQRQTGRRRKGWQAVPRA